MKKKRKKANNLLRFFVVVVGWGSMSHTHLVAETGVAAADVLFVGWAHGETHVSVEPRRAELAACAACAYATCAARPPWGRCVRGVVVKVEVDGGGAADVGVAANSVVLDGLWRVEREEREGRAGRLLRALHLQNYSEGLYGSFSAMSGLLYRPLAVASRATLLDLLRYVDNFEIILVWEEKSAWALS